MVALKTRMLVLYSRGQVDAMMEVCDETMTRWWRERWDGNFDYSWWFPDNMRYEMRVNEKKWGIKLKRQSDHVRKKRRIDRVSLFTQSSLITASDSMSSMHFTCAVTARYSLCRSEIWANIAHRHRPLTRYQSQSSVRWNNRKRNVPVSYVGWQHSFRWSVSLRQLT